MENVTVVECLRRKQGDVRNNFDTSSIPNTD